MTAKWLLECFGKGYLLPVEQYIPLNYQPIENPVLEQPGIKRTVPKSNSLTKKEAVKLVQHQKADEDDLLSQYVNNDSTLSKFWSKHFIKRQNLCIALMKNLWCHLQRWT